MDKETLKRIAQGLKTLEKEKQAELSDAEHETEVAKLALMLESNQTIVDAIKANKTDFSALAQVITEAVSQIKVESPKVEVPEVKVSIPEIKIPDFPEFRPFPEVKIPKIVVPEPKVTVNVPKIELPTINIPETVINFPEKMDVGLGDFSLKNPLPVINVDPKGNYVSPTLGGGGGPRRVKIDNDSSEPIPIFGTVSATFSADFGSGEIGSQTLRTVQATNAISSVYVTGANGTIGVVTINPDGLPVYGGSSSGGGLTDTELRASSVPIAQVSGANWSVSVVDIFGSAATSMLNGDNRLRVAVDTGSSGLTDSELRATSLTVNQLSGAAWSMSVIDIYGTTATNLVNPDGRLKVELPSGASGLTDTELRASHLDVQQVSGATDSVNVVSTVGLTDTQLRAASVAVQQVSGAIDSVNVVTMPAVTVTSITNSTAISILNGDGTTLDPRNRNWTITETVPISSANTLDIKQVSGASDSVNVLSMPSVTVTSITNSTASALVDSSGVQYSGSNPVPTKEVRSATPSQTSPSVGVASTSILAANTSRLGATIYNEGTATCYMKLGATASLTSYTLQIASGGYYEVPFGYTGAIDGITSASTAQLRVTEIT